MSSTSDSLINYLRGIVGAWRDDPRDDAELLARFAASHDELAFKALAWRHSPLVWRTCTSILGATPDAEDTFQTVFLILTRKAGKLRREPLAGWLYRVTRRAALNVYDSAQRRRRLEQELPSVAKPKVVKEDGGRTDLYKELDEEMACLPERLRVPLLLRYIEGQTLEEVARVVGCSRRALGKRLEKGEVILRKRLEQRGLTLGTVSLAMLLGNTSTTPAVSGRLIESTARSAMAFQAGTLTGIKAEGARKLLHALTMEGMTRAGWWLVLVSVCFVGIGRVGWQAWKMFGVGSDAVTPAVPNSTMTVATEAKEVVKTRYEKVDLYGDPLPEGAIARIGTIRFRSGSDNEGVIGDVAFMPGGKTLVSVHGGDYVHFWETTTGKELRRLDVKAKCQKVVVSRGGEKLAVLGRDKIQKLSLVSIWNLATNTPRLLWQQKIGTKPNAQVVSATFAPDDKTLVVASDVVQLFDIPTGKARQVLEIKGLGHLALSPNGKVLVANGKLWDIATATQRCMLKELLDKEGSVRGVHSLDFSPDGRLLAVTHWGDYNKHSLHVFDVTNGSLHCQVAGEDHNSFVTFLSDGQTLLEAGLGVGIGHIRFWDSTTGKKAKSRTDVTCSNLIQGFPGGTCISSDGKFLAQADGCTVGVWDVATGREIGPMGVDRTAMRAMALSPDNKTLITLANPTELRIWDAETGRLRKMEKYNHLIGPPLGYFDGRRIALSTFDPEHDKGVSYVGIGYDIQTGKFSKDAALVPPTQISTSSFTASSDGRWQLWGSPAKLVLVDRSTGKESCISIPGLEDVDSPMSISGNGGSVLLHYRRSNERSKGGWSQLEVWSTRTSKCRMNRRVDISWADKPISALSPDGQWIAFAPKVIAKDEPAIQLWEVASGTKAENFTTSGTALCSVAWSPDGSLLVGGDENGDIWLWDMRTGLPTRHISGHRGGVKSLLFSLSGRRLVSESYDTTALVWDLQNLPQPDTKVTQLPSANDLWKSLGSQDATKGLSTMHLLTRHPDVALPLLRERLQPVHSSDPTRVATLLAQLNDDNFQARKEAFAELEKLGETVLEPMQRALEEKPPIEVRRQLEELIRALTNTTLSLPLIRGVKVLEQIGTPEARQALEELTRLPAGSVQAQEAGSALQRLAKSKPLPAP